MSERGLVHRQLSELGEMGFNELCRRTARTVYSCSLNTMRTREPGSNLPRYLCPGQSTIQSSAHQHRATFTPIEHQNRLPILIICPLDTLILTLNLI